MSLKKEKYIKLKHEEHVLKRPDTYVGSTDKTVEDLWYYNEESKRMIKAPLSYVPGEFKIFDEIIVNAHDQYIRINENRILDPSLITVKTIEITYNKDTGEISVYNDGEGISIELHETGVYIPELIFGHLLTSSNYEDDKDAPKHVGGKNGYGAKLTNIFSKKFKIETVDKDTKKMFSMTFYDNMKRKDPPIIKKCKGKPFTRITYTPDYSLFKETGLHNGMIKVIEKRAYDLAGCTDNSVAIILNGKRIDCKSFERYIDLFIGSKTNTIRAFEKVNDRWTIAACLSPNLSFEQISFVNGIYTYHGGKHVDYVTNQITKKICELISKKKKITVKPNYIKENIMIFINSTIDDPSFNSQTKECLNTVYSKFGSKCELSSKFIDTLSKCGIIERAIDLSSIKDNCLLKKTDGKKTSRLKGIPKLDDANWAGTKKAGECTLILTEGDSAKAMAMAGLSVVGRDQYGVFPLKGKMLNVRDSKNLKKLPNNDELNNIKKILGLQTGKNYKNTSELRYGKVLLLTDQDEDGSHIKGLLFNVFETLWPTLFKCDGFLNGMLTPVVKIRKGPKTINFYSVKDYEMWRKKNESEKGWNSKYYKGLGTSTPAEAKEYFRLLKIVKYTGNEDTDKTAMDLAFGKEDTSANNRKEWLNTYNREKTLDYTKKTVTVKDFVHTDLIHFSNSDNVRSIPCLIDGLKPSQRKVLYCAFKRNLVKEIRVAQFAGYVSEHGAYHHGEASLQGTIINMAQDFVGSNNINLFEPIGQFGSRILGGKDSAQPRYIHTALSKYTSKIYNKLDNPLYKYINDDGLSVEPVYYVPIIPVLLVNGSHGIGTGWSTDIPQYNPIDIIKNIHKFINNEELLDMTPWYKNFKGTISITGPKTYTSKGKYYIDNEKILITELPIGMWTEKYKEFLETITIDSKKQIGKQGILKYYTSHCTDTDVHFELYFQSETLEDLIYNNGYNEIEKMFRLTSNINISNMVYYDRNCKIKKGDNVLDMLVEYCEVRLEFYEKRRLYLIHEISKEIELLKERIRFILEYINGIILINNKRKVEIEAQLETRNYIKVENSYDFLLRMPIYNLTKDKIEEFTETLKGKNSNLEFLNENNDRSLWKTDLEELEELLNKTGYNKKKKIIKKIIKKTS